jgi:hypothetical protein
MSFSPLHRYYLFRYDWVVGAAFLRKEIYDVMVWLNFEEILYLTEGYFQ